MGPGAGDELHLTSAGSAVAAALEMIEQFDLDRGAATQFTLASRAGSPAEGGDA